MKFNIRSLDLSFRQGPALVKFSKVTYFWGQMGAGKTSIAKMIDYCLGGRVELSPAMQSEFVAATLTLELKNGILTIERERGASNVLVSWETSSDAFQLLVPSRVADGVVLPGTEVETLSDLIFHLSGLTPPRVRKSKRRDDSESARLSMRDLFWYCYLDQDEIDSSFFFLQRGGDTFKQLKSRDVLRYIIGFHDERVAELEADLDRLRGERISIIATIESLSSALKQVGIESELEIDAQKKDLAARYQSLQIDIATLRVKLDIDKPTEHAADKLRDDALTLDREIADLDSAMTNLSARTDQDRRHLSELEMLSVGFKRSLSAREILSGVKFSACPRCAQTLPERDPRVCHVCGQTDVLVEIDTQEMHLVEKDLRARMSELQDILQRHGSAMIANRKEKEERLARKHRVERERNQASARYDSAYLSTVLVKEHQSAAIIQDIANLDTLARFPRLLAEQTERLENIVGQESTLRVALRDAKAAAEEDETNLEVLKDLFLDCLLRAKIPGVSELDEVRISKTDFFPVIRVQGLANETETSFTTLSSGGKKTLFKCCFAVAIHRLAMKLNAPLPNLMIIDSPMKNISERENREQFHSFYDMLYELSTNELNSTQIVLIDKEFAAPSENLDVLILHRHMKPNDTNNPPLIPNYRGN